MSNDKFWMIRVEGGGPPTAVFASYSSAMLRAHNLAQQTKSRVFILESVTVATPVLPREEEIPVKMVPVVADES